MLMSECGKCCGSCGGCGQLVLSEGEILLLQKLGQIPFLPVARRIDSTDPIYLEDATYTVAEYSLILQCLEKRGLISVDFDKPLKGFPYADYPIHGSIALTARGQEAVQSLEIQGLQE